MLWKAHQRVMCLHFPWFLVLERERYPCCTSVDAEPMGIMWIPQDRKARRETFFSFFFFSFFGYFMYLHFKYYPLSWFPLQNPLSHPSSPCSLTHPLLRPCPGIPYTRASIFHRKRTSPPIDVPQGHPLLHMRLEQTELLEIKTAIYRQTEPQWHAGAEVHH